MRWKWMSARARLWMLWGDAAAAAAEWYVKQMKRAALHADALRLEMELALDTERERMKQEGLR